MITQEEYEVASIAGDRLREAYEAVAVRYDERERLIVVELAGGRALSVPTQLLQGLEDATPDDLRSIEIDASGLGLHIEGLDWDMSVPGIMQGRYGSPRWMATHRPSGVVRSGPSRGR